MEFPGLQKILEPELMFEAFTPNPYSTHPLKGLLEFGPYSHKLSPIDKIRIAVICPVNCFHTVQNLFNEFSKTHNPSERVNYLYTYTGFEQIFRTKLELLDINNSI